MTATLYVRTLDEVIRKSFRKAQVFGKLRRHTEVLADLLAHFVDDLCVARHGRGLAEHLPVDPLSVPHREHRDEPRRLPLLRLRVVGVGLLDPVDDVVVAPGGYAPVLSPARPAHLAGARRPRVLGEAERRAARNLSIP